MGAGAPDRGRGGPLRREAQGLYYKEIRKDDRIYVFNNAEEAADSRHPGKWDEGITRPGTGPNGETVVGDSERALQLFYFKHNISEAVPEPTPPLQRIVWSDGKTRISTDFAYLEISNRVQGRYTHEFPDDLITILPGTGAAGRFEGLVPHPSCQVQARGVVLDSTPSGSLASARSGSLPPHHAEAVL